MIEIKHRHTHAVLLRSETATTIRDALAELCAGEGHQRWRRGEPGGVRAYLRGANLRGANLGGAYLSGANLSRANLSYANLSYANLSYANLSGANLSGADLRGADLSGADLRGANLSGANLSGADLGGADLGGAYLRGADLSGAYLRGADLSGADLRGADLSGAYLASARNAPAGIALVDPPEPYVRAEPSAASRAERARRYRETHPEVPVVEQLDARILAIVDGPAAAGRLDMSDWHHGNPCGTTHCRAGWAIHLAGEAGRALEEQHGPQGAGSMIYRASTGRVPHFFGSTDAALDDIRRCAQEQTEGAEK